MKDIKKVALFYLLVSLICLLCSANTLRAANDGDESGYPLIKGNYWIYQGRAKWQADGNRVIEKQPIIKMQIIDVITRDHLIAAIMRGDLRDYHDEGPDPSDHLILRVGTSTYYDIDHDRMDAILKRLKDPKASLGGLLREDEEPDLDLPLVVEKVFGNPELITRQDQYYSWVVVKEETIDLTAVKGLESFGKRKQYTLRYFTAPDEVYIGFVPGVGVTEYNFKHHGTVDEADLKLIEAKIR